MIVEIADLVDLELNFCGRYLDPTINERIDMIEWVSCSLKSQRAWRGGEANRSLRGH